MGFKAKRISMTIERLETKQRMSRVVKHNGTIYVKDMSYFAQMNAVWDAWIPEGFAPARACVAAKMAREALLVEISVVAAEI
mgnify:CR=1 FL=1